VFDCDAGQQVHVWREHDQGCAGEGLVRHCCSFGALCFSSALCRLQPDLRYLIQFKLFVSIHIICFNLNESIQFKLFVSIQIIRCNLQVAAWNAF